MLIFPQPRDSETPSPASDFKMRRSAAIVSPHDDFDKPECDGGTCRAIPADGRLRNLDEIRDRLQANADSEESQRCESERVIARNVRNLRFGQIGALF